MEEQKKKGPGRPEKYSHDTKLGILREWKRYQSNRNGRGSKRGFCRYCLPGELNPRTLDRILAYALQAETEYEVTERSKRMRSPETPRTPPPVIPNPFAPLPLEDAAQSQDVIESDDKGAKPSSDETAASRPVWFWT